MVDISGISLVLVRRSQAAWLGRGKLIPGSPKLNYKATEETVSSFGKHV